MREQYVAFETAKLLKEKGFNIGCQKVYLHDGNDLWAQNFMCDSKPFVDNEDIDSIAQCRGWIKYLQGDYAYLCPTQSLVMRWLREVHKVFIELTMNRNTYLWGYRVLLQNGDIVCFSERYATYEYACETSMAFCLENVI